MKCNGYRC